MILQYIIFLLYVKLLRFVYYNYIFKQQKFVREYEYYEEALLCIITN
jgi:hypothetical protein